LSIVIFLGAVLLHVKDGHHELQDTRGEGSVHPEWLQRERGPAHTLIWDSMRERFLVL
jgi:hypothetical protein